MGSLVERASIIHAVSRRPGTDPGLLLVGPAGPPITVRVDKRGSASRLWSGELLRLQR